MLLWGVQSTLAEDICGSTTWAVSAMLQCMCRSSQKVEALRSLSFLFDDCDICAGSTSRTAIKTQSIFHPGATKHLPSSQVQAQHLKSSTKERAGLQSSSVLDRAALLHKRRRMDSGLQLALSDAHGRTAA